ncbi:hypothetical protein APS05_25875 [Salmonella enterica subsp. enterica serovar Typhimurium]|nr:hypothetical protein [Salmonella enterica subsp. enterica serovar Typhimurium]
MIEVALRNAINNTIKANHGPAWYDSIPQTKKSQDLVLNAKQKALDLKTKKPPGKVVFRRFSNRQVSEPR